MKKLNSILLLLSILCKISISHAAPILKPIQGIENIDFADLQGKWVLINYWASWCHSCLEEITQLNQFYATHKQSAVLLAVNFDNLSVTEQLELIEKWHINYPSLSHDPASLLGLGEIRGLPATFIFNPEGKLVKTLYGTQSCLSLTKALH